MSIKSYLLVVVLILLVSNARGEVYAEVRCDINNPTITYTGIAYQDKGWEALKQRPIRLYGATMSKWESKEFRDWWMNMQRETRRANKFYGCIVS